MHDLSKLRIDRDAPPAVRRAFARNHGLAGAALAVIAIVVVLARHGIAVPVQVVVAAPS